MCIPEGTNKTEEIISKSLEDMEKWQIFRGPEWKYGKKKTDFSSAIGHS